MRTAWLKILALSTLLTLAAAGAALAHVEISPLEVPQTPARSSSRSCRRSWTSPRPRSGWRCRKGSRSRT